MATMTLKDLAEKMSDIDLCMFSTREANGGVSTRPMSNNGDVEYDGDNWFFTFEHTRKVEAIRRDPRVTIGMNGKPSLLGKPGIFIVIEGTASISKDRAEFEAHWDKNLDYWFKDGIDTPGIALIKVSATRIEYWHDEQNDVIIPS